MVFEVYELLPGGANSGDGDMMMVTQCILGPKSGVYGKGGPSMEILRSPALTTPPCDSSILLQTAGMIEDCQ